MQRWHSPREQHLMSARWKIEMEKHGYDWRNPPTDPAACHCAAGIGAVRKKKPGDCGRPGCGLCHENKKIYRARKRREKRVALDEEFASSDLTLTY